MNETNLVRLIALEASRLGHRLMRNNTAVAWVGEVVARTPTTITIKNPRPLHAGLTKGGSDLIGWTSDGRFAAIEAKMPTGRLSPEQSAFIDAVNHAGGRAGVARGAEDVERILGSRT